MATERGALDRFLDTADSVVGGLERVYGKTPAGADVEIVDHAPKPATAALVPRWRVTSLKTTGGSQSEVWFVSNGTQTCSCDTKALADRICMLLGGTP